MLHYFINDVTCLDLGPDILHLYKPETNLGRPFFNLTFIHLFTICGTESEMFPHVTSVMVWCHDYVFSMAQRGISVASLEGLADAQMLASWASCLGYYGYI